MNDILIWAGILFCVLQSAMFSGLNLAFFSVTRLLLEIEAEEAHDDQAEKVLNMRKDSNFLLTTILWGNVGINVLLTLLSDSVMAGVVSFLFSTFVITLFGEIIPQAYFSRNALKMAALLSPILKIYQFLLYPVAKPSALILDRWLGKESPEFLSENIIKAFIKKHIDDHTSEIDVIEGVGAINFLNIDEIRVTEEGETINPMSIISLDTDEHDNIIFPEFKPVVSDPFIRKINQSYEKWVIFTDHKDQPRLALDADGFIRSIYAEHPIESIMKYCHKPMIITNPNKSLGTLLVDIREKFDTTSDKPIDEDLALVWLKDSKRIITGADIFGRLLKGI